MNKLDEYKEIYYKELEHAECLRNKISTSITFLTIIGTALTYIFKNIIKYSTEVEILPSIVVFFTCICFILFIVVAIKFYKAHTNSYEYFPIKDFHEFILQCEDACWKNDEEKNEYINNEKINMYYSISVHNREVITNKINIQNKLNIWIIINLMVLLLTYILMCFVEKI